MHKAVDGAASHLPRPFHGAGLFQRFLFCQLFLCRLQLFAPLFHTELTGGGLLLLAVLSEFGLGRFRDTLSRSAVCLRPGLFPGASLGRAGGSPGPGLLLPEFCLGGLWDTLSRSIGGPAPGSMTARLRPRLRPFITGSPFHFSCPPGGWSAGYKSPPWGNGQ